MTLSLEHFLDLIDAIPKGESYDYVKVGTNKIRLNSVDHTELFVSATKVEANGSEKNANITTESLKQFVNKVQENKPLHIESVWNGSGSARSAWEGLFAHTSEFYTYFSKGRKYLVWMPSRPHTVGVMQEITYMALKELSASSNMRIWHINSKYRPYIAAIKSKPFLLLAGISGTGKSRIVRELARACWDEDSEEFKAQKPRNFEMVQVKPNWHDSTELVGYVSRVSGKAEFVAGDFLKFVARAWQELDVPYFLCLDEMNLAPVEQYFAEYLSVVESRKVDEDGEIKTDALLKKESEQWYYDLIARLTSNDEVKTQFLNEGIALPQNLIVVGTVNMDETTFSFSRKVLDRAMTIEMNEVDLHGGLETRHEPIGRIGAADLIGRAVEGVDVYAENKEVCDKVLTYLQSVNDVLDKEGKPFKVAYRTRNEFLLYVVNNLPYNEDEQGNTLPTDYVIARAVDEITNMKILPRIEGDDTKVTDKLLDSLKNAIEDGLKALTGEEQELKSVAIAKIDEMKKRLDESGYTSYWS